MRLSSTDSDWDEALSVGRAVAAKRHEINVCKQDILERQIKLQCLERELDELTWPARLSDRPRLWPRYSRSSERERLMEQSSCPNAWVLLQSPKGCRPETVRQFFESPDSEARRDPALLRLCLQKSSPDWWATTLLEPTPSIQLDRSLVVQIVRQCPAFMQHRNIPLDFFSEQEFFKATVMGILQTKSGTSILYQFSETLREDAELMLITIQALLFRFRARGDPSLVGAQP